MKLEVEYWVEEQRFSKDVQVLFEESIICYKAGAYRSSFLTSYLAFLQVIKERLLEGERPVDAKEGHWKNIIDSIQKEDTWESGINTALSQKNSEKTKNLFFSISNNVMEDLKYFRRRRNDCAHAKSMMINNSHVESFWLFLYTYLPKIVINGGKEALLMEIEKFFDYTYTNPNKNHDYLIDKIRETIDPNEMNEFYSRLIEIADYSIDEFFEDYSGEAARVKLFWKDIFMKGNEQIREGLIEYLKKDEFHFTVFAINNPNVLEYFSKDDSLIRRIWMDKLYVVLSKYFEPLDHWPLISHLIGNKFLADEEIELLIDKLVLQFVKNNDVDPYKEHLSLINAYGFGHKLKEQILSILSKDYVSINKKAAPIIFHIENYGIQSEIAMSLNSLFNNGYSYGALKKQLDQIFLKNPIVKQKFKEILNEIDGVTINDYFE